MVIPARLCRSSLALRDIVIATDRLDNLFNHSQAVVLSGLKAHFAVQGIEALPFFLQKSIESSDSLLRELGGYRTKRVVP